MENIFEKLAAINPHILEKVAKDTQDNKYLETAKNVASGTATQLDRILPVAPIAGGLGYVGSKLVRKGVELTPDLANTLRSASPSLSDTAAKGVASSLVENGLPILGAGIGAGIGGYAGHWLGEKVNMPTIGQGLGMAGGLVAGALAGNAIKQASVLAPTLTAKFAAEQEVEPRKLPKQNKYDLLYYPDVTQHALAAGLTVGAAPMLGLGLPHPAVGLTTGLGVYAGGKLGRGLGAVAGFPNAGALAGEIAGGVGGLVAGKHLM